MPTYTNPTHLAHVPQMLKDAIASGDLAAFREIHGFTEFDESIHDQPVPGLRDHNETIESFYAYVLSSNFACLKSPFLIAMIGAAAGAPAELAEALMYTTIPAIVCLIDVWTRCTDGGRPVAGYAPSPVLPLDQIAFEFVSSFGDHITTDIFDEALNDNERYYREHTVECDAIDSIHMDTSSYESWIAAMCTMEPFSAMTEAESRKAYDDLKARICSDTSQYRDMIRESLHRRVSLRKCSSRIRQLAEAVNIALRHRQMTAAASPERAERGGRSMRPTTTPARAQTPAAPRNHRAIWNKPVSA